jgi:hypothetical protein
MNAEYHGIMIGLQNNPANIFLQDDDEDDEDEDYGKKDDEDEEDENEEDEDEEQDGGYSVGSRAAARLRLPKNP